MLRGQHNVLRLLLLLLLMGMSLLKAWLVSKLPLLRRLEGRSVLMRLLLLLRKVRGLLLLLAHPRSKLLLRRLPSGSRRVDELNGAARPSSHCRLLRMLVIHGLLWLGRLVQCAAEVLLLVRVRWRRGNVPTSTVLLLLIVGVDLLRM